MTAMRPIQTLPLLASLVLFAGVGEAAAVETHRGAPDLVGAADDSGAAADRPFEGDVDGATVAPQRPRAPRAPAAATPSTSTATRSGSDSRTLPTRFHSFLPGMFR